MSTQQQVAQSALSTTMTLDQAMLAIANIGVQLHAVTQSVSTAHENSQVVSAQVDALELPVQIVEKRVEVLPPNFLDVKAFANALGTIVGAKGDGKTDDTEILQFAIDTAAKLGMVCWFSEGRYLVDPRVQLLPRTGSWIQFHPNALLKAKPNAEQRTNVIYLDAVTDVWILGIRVEGDRMEHDYSNPGTEEWGHGIKATNSCKRIVIRAFDIRRCHGDGLSISSEDVYLYRGVSTENRRQGLTVGSARRMRVVDCEFSKTKALTVNGLTNPHTAPGAGIDIEPDKFDAEDILIENCRIFDNATTGILMWMRSEVGKTISKVILRGNTIYGNANQVQSKALSGFIQYEAYGNNIRYEAGSGFRLEAGTIAVIGGNTETSADRNFIQKSTGARSDFTTNKLGTNTAGDIRVIAATGTQIPVDLVAGWNTFR